MGRALAAWMIVFAAAAAAAACHGGSSGDTTDAAPAVCASLPPDFAAGDPNGAANPLAIPSGQARAGRITAAQLPPVPSGLITWKGGDFVLANEKVALVIEDVGDSDLYDPWGGRPVGLARVENGALVEPNNFGEMFLLIGRSTLVTDSVTVIADGSQGGPAIIRAHGKLHPVPFFESVIAVLFPDAYTDLDAAIDYQLAPGDEHVDITMHVRSPRTDDITQHTLLHAFMYTSRTPAFQPVDGFNVALGQPYIALIDDDATSWAYVPAAGPMSSPLAVAGFLGGFTAGYTITACSVTDEPRAKLVIGGPGVDGINAAVARTLGTAQRTITGTVTRAGVAADGVRVHATDASGGYVTRVTTAADGTFSLGVPATADITLTAYKRGDEVVTAHPGTGTTATIDLPATGAIHVTATEGGVPTPVRVQILPATGSGAPTVPTVPANFGEAQIVAGRLHVAFPPTGDVTLPVPPGTWQVMTSRGYEYEIDQQTVTVTAGATNEVAVSLDRSVDTTGFLCGDFHVHTWRSNDSGDDTLTKISQAVADGVELPIRSDHEWIGDFSAEIAQLGVQKWAAAISSIELTSFQVWGHMGVFPLVADPTAVNNGAPKWQTFPTAADPTIPFQTLSPPAVFDAVRARPEAPIIIINHPRSSTDYFTYVGLDPATGLATNSAAWDTKFTLVEVFNNADWVANRNGIVDDWLALLRAGRKIFAVGSSDSHVWSTSPVGYPRTCVHVGTDDPQAVTPNMVRDQLAAGHGFVSGGIYVNAALGSAGPGDTTTGAGVQQMVDVTVQAATWVDVTSLEVVVDGQTADTIPIMPSDADPTNPVIRYHAQVPVTVQATGGFVVFAAYGTRSLAPVHPGKIPFGVTEPIFVTP
jgi:hypothetical protein